VSLTSEELSRAGHYIAVLKGNGADQTKTFFVTPGPVKKISFLARPSRVPVAKPDAISGTAFVFDNSQNLVLEPTPVSFSIGVQGAAAATRKVDSRDGVAWIKAGSAIARARRSSPRWPEKFQSKE